MSAFVGTPKFVQLTDPGGRLRTPPKNLAGDRANSYQPMFVHLCRRGVWSSIWPGKGGNMGKGARAASTLSASAGAMPSSIVLDS